jgi:Skp family chaperone for outer membrane proteins
MVAVCAAVFVFGYNSGSVNAGKAFAPAKVGVVSVRRVFENNKKSMEWQAKQDQQRDKIVAELKAISRDLEALRGDIATRQEGSSDYYQLMRELMEKEASLKAKKDFYEQEMMTKEKVWTEELYQDIIAKTKMVAQEKGLDVVLAKEEMNFPTESASDLMLMVKTSKLLYYSDALDITDDVLAAVDGER